MKKMENSYVHLEDVKRFVRRRKKRLYLIFTLSFFFFFLVFLSLTPKYVLEATFKEGGVKSESRSSEMLRSLLKDVKGVDHFSNCISHIRSRSFQKSLIEKVGLQAKVKEISLFKQIKKKWRRHLSLIRDKGSYENIYVRVKNVKYEGKRPYLIEVEILQNEIKIKTNKGYYSLKKENPVFTSEEINFSLEIEPMFVGEALVEFLPLEVAFQKTLENLRASQQKEDPSLISLKFKHEDSKLGSLFLNELMSEYQIDLHKEFLRVSENQLSYLLDREKTITDSYEKNLNEHAEQLKETIGEKGFINFTSELEKLENERSSKLQEKNQVGIHLENFENLLKKKIYWIDEPSLSHEARENQKHLLSLKKEKGQLNAFLSDKKITKDIKPTLIHKSLFFDHLLEKKQRNEKDDFLFFPSNSSHSKLKELELERRKILNHLSQDCKRECFDHLDLKSAKELYESYIKKQESEHYRQTVLKELMNTSFFANSKIRPFIQSLEDGVTLNLYEKILDLHTKAYVSGDYSIKEKARLEKGFLKHHQEIKKEIESLFLASLQKSTYFKDSINQLQKKISELLEIEIKALEQQIQEQMIQKKKMLLFENEQIERDLEKIKTELKEIPEKWVMENKLQLKANINVAVIQAISQLIESKSMSMHLVNIESKVVDKAYLPLTPKTYPIVLYAFIFGALTTFFSLAMLILKQISHGFICSAAGLKFRGIDSISLKLQKGSKTEIRKIAEFIYQDPKKFNALFLNNSFDFTKDLSNLLKKSSKKHLFIHCFRDDLNFRALEDALEDMKNLGSNVVLTLNSEDQIEWINTENFKNCLNHLKLFEGFVFFVVTHPLNSLEVFKTANLVDKCIFNLNEEPFELLEDYIKCDFKKLLAVCLD